MKVQVRFFSLFIFLIPLQTLNISAQTILEAEDAYFTSGSVETEHAGYTGTGFVDTENNFGEAIEWFINAANSVTGSIDFRYALGKDEHRYMEIYVNDEFIDTIDFDNSGAFTTYIYKSVTATLNEGINRVKALSVNAEGAPNMDHLRILADTAALPYCHVSVTSGANGSVSVDPVADSFIVGTILTATADPDPGYSFSGWTGSVESTQNPLVFAAVDGFTVSAGYEFALRAFPGAEGYAKNITGGRGGVVYQVTNLNDNGPGSLRYGIALSGPRIIVFRVSGTIHLLSELQIKNPNITIAGQTAPGDGITLADYPLKIDADNVIVRFLRSRLGDVYQLESDAFDCHEQNGVIVDHCSFSWSIDECASFYSNTNFIMQWCIISESLYDSYHSKGRHGYGGIWGGDHATMHHNLFAHHTSRNPRFNGARYNGGWNEQVDYRNNVIYNWGFNSAYGAEPSDIDGNKASYNLVNNYYKYGPATSASVRSRIIQPDPQDAITGAGYSYFYVDGNYVYGNSAISADNWNGGVSVSAAVIDEIKLDEPVAFDSITQQPAEMAYEHVLAWTGCVLPGRDPVDNRIINEVITGTAVYGGTYGEGRGIIDSQETVGGWPELNSTTPPTDSDNDGMSDTWELANGLNPNDAGDQNEDSRGLGYTNIEYYLNDLVAEHTYLIRPMHFTLDGYTESQVSLSWEDSTDNEDGFLLEKAVRGGEFEVVSVIAPNTTSFVDEIEALDTLTYRLRAFNATDTSLYTDVVKIQPVLSSVSGKVMIDENNIDLYPNPFETGFTLKFNLASSENMTIALNDFMGRQLYILHHGSLTGGEHEIQFHRPLNTGVYYLLIKTDNQAIIKKIVRM
jgi:hypothetical protein